MSGKLSIKAGVSQRFSWADLSVGLKRSIQQGCYHTHPTTYPYRSVRDLIRSLYWPPGNSYQFLGDYPSNTSPGWTDNIQGVTHDKDHWFFTEAFRLWQIPLSRDLNVEIDFKDFLTVKIPDILSQATLQRGPYDHMGSLDCFEGLLYVPLEGSPNSTLTFVPAPQPALVLFEAKTLNFIGWNALSHQGAAPWCAVNPRNHLLYSSDFNSQVLKVYDRGILSETSAGGAITGVEPQYLYDFQLFGFDGAPLTVSRIQSGTFSPSGHLYLLSDVDDGGLMGFDTTTGRLIFQWFKRDFPASAEMEGVTIFDTDGLSIPNIGGQIHFVWDSYKLVKSDDVYFSHIRVAEADRSFI